MFTSDRTATLNSIPPQLSSHDRILIAAKHLFARGGYENTSTVAIAREAGTSESQLMKHFGSKQGLLSAILDRGWQRISERIHMAQLNAATPDKLFGVFEAVAIELEKDPELKDLMMLEARRVRKDNTDVLLSHGFREFSNLIDHLLVDMRNEGQIRPDVNLEAVRAAYIGMIEGLLRDQVVAKRSAVHANYGLDDVRKVLGILIPAFNAGSLQEVKASK